MLKFLQTLALDFPHICLNSVIFPGNFSRQVKKTFYRQMYRILKSGSSADGAACNALKIFRQNPWEWNSSLLTVHVFFFTTAVLPRNYTEYCGSIFFFIMTQRICLSVFKQIEKPWQCSVLLQNTQEVLLKPKRVVGGTRDVVVCFSLLLECSIVILTFS